MSHMCLERNLPVTNRQQALLCDGCELWCHSTCGTGISQQQYRNAVRDEKEIEWNCKRCAPAFNPTLRQSTPEYVSGKSILN